MRAASWIFLACWTLMGAALSVILLRTFWPFTVDDTFITLRYGLNVAQGHGPVYNPGERAEGYTTFAWMLLAAAAHLFARDCEIIAKVGSLVAAAAQIALTVAFAAAVAGQSVRPAQEGPRTRTWAAVIAMVILAVYPGTAVHAVTGMETSLFAAACMGVFLLALRLIDDPEGPETQRSTYLFAGAALVVALVRPDGNLIALMTGSTVWLLRPVLRRRLATAMALVYVLPGALYFAWRWNYYGHLLPLPFYVKAVKASFLAGAQEGEDFLHELLWGSVPVGVLAAAGIALHWRRRKGAGPPRLLPPLAACAALFIFYLVPAPLMAFNHRYLHPIVPVVAALAGAGLAEVRARLRARAPRTWQALAIDLAALGLFAALGPARAMASVGGAVTDLTSYGAGLHRAHIAIGKKLATVKDPAAHSVAILDAGALPYLSGWRTIDTFGLNDPHVALGGRGDVPYVLDQHPDALVFVSKHAEAFEAVFDYEAPLHDEAVLRGYAPVEVEEFQPSYYLWVFTPHGRVPWN